MSEDPAVPPRPRSRFPMAARILVAMVAGIAVGPFLGDRASVLGVLGTTVIQLIKAVATPLLFLAIVRALASVRVRGSSMVRMVAIALVNVSVAVAIGLFLSNLVEPGKHLEFTRAANVDDFSSKRFDWVKTLQGLFPKDVLSPFVENNVLGVVFLALFFGFALRALGRATESVEHRDAHEAIVRVVLGLYRTTEIVLGWVLELIPFAVFGVVAKTVGQYGLAPLRGLSLYVAVGLGGLTLHALVTYQLWLRLWVKMPLGTFLREAKKPMAVAFGSNSSLATLPLTLGALDRLGCSRSASAVGACVGTNLNNDGIVLYEGMAVLLVAQATGIDLPLGDQILIALFCVVAAMGVAGIPEAGIISLALVLNAAHLPLELLPLLLTVDWVIARGRSVLNVLSDMVLSLVLDRFERRDPAAPGAVVEGVAP